MGLQTYQVHVRKVKLLKAPKFDLGALLTLHGESATDESGQKVSLMKQLKFNCASFVAKKKYRSCLGKFSISEFDI